MCICFIAINQSVQHPLLLVFNRDEYYKRFAEKLKKWSNENLYAGTDLQSKGTWLAADSQGRFAAITHFRDPKNHKAGMGSRGALVPSFLRSGLSPLEFIENMQSMSHEYNGFSMILGEKNEVFYYSQKVGVYRKLESGIYGLSNGEINSDWPKVKRGIGLMQILLQKEYSLGNILDIMLDSKLADDTLLPKTGVSYAIEKAISSIFVLTPDYGTKTSTLFAVEKNGNLKFMERTFEKNSKIFEETIFDF